jgi:hypothetical protein
MGMDRKVTFAPGRLPPWADLAPQLSQRGLELQMRMIDGQLAFPDETPPDDWREVRVALGGGMITLRRDADGITLVTWGNADSALVQAWNDLALALAEVTGGTVITPSS